MAGSAHKRTKTPPTKGKPIADRIGFLEMTCRVSTKTTACIRFKLHKILCLHVYMTRKVSSARHMNASTKLLRCGLSTAERRNRLRRCTVVSGRPACNTVCRGYTVLTPGPSATACLSSKARTYAQFADGFTSMTWKICILLCHRRRIDVQYNVTSWLHKTGSLCFLHIYSNYL